MKKTILTLMSFVMTLGIVNVNAQSPLSFGAKLEMNTSNYLLKDLGDQSSKMKVGPNLTGFMKINVNESFAIQPELSVFYRQSKMEFDNKKDDTFKQWGMQIPVYALGQIRSLTGNNFYIGAGPYVGFGFDARYDDADMSLYKERNGDREMTRWDFGLATLVGYEFSNGFQLNAGYQIGFINQLDALKDDHKMLNQVVNFGIGYRF